MIPQRNISVLSNRLAVAGRRIREDVLERDYCLAWFLCALAQSDLRELLAFKGGTALKRCYFPEYRFSEDLDFTLLSTTTFEDIQKRLESVYAAVKEGSGISFAFDRKDTNSHTNSHTFYLKYTGPLPSSNDVKVDITIREDIVGYIVDIVRATRQHESVLVGAGPRATQSLLLASRAFAALNGRDFVTPDDIKAMAVPVLEHRLILRPEFEIEGLSVSEVIERILQEIAVHR